MYFMYVDESGDTGIHSVPTSFFILTGLVFHELRWFELLEDLIAFRKDLRRRTGWKLRDEIHSQDLINGRPSRNRNLSRYVRLEILRNSVDWIAGQNDIRVITIMVKKRHKENAAQVFDLAWGALIQRFENTLSYRNFTGPMNPDERGFLIPDNTNGKQLVKIVRRMRRYNPVPNIQTFYAGGSRNLPLSHIVEDPFTKDSRHSFFLQMADVVAYCGYQHIKPNSYMKKKGGKRYYLRLDPVLLKEASPRHPLGMVVL